jgi:tetratricopeptide (TPR) repeat protein
MLCDLTLLTESSLVLTEEVALESGPEIRFRMLETLREYGAELLSTQEKERLSDRHSAYFFDLIEAYAASDHSRDRDRLDPDLDNLRTALLWSADRPDQSEQTLRMAIAMFGLWIWWGHQVEAREWVERFLVCAPPDSPLLAEALNVAGNLCFYMNDAEASLGYQQRHLELRRTLKDELGIARALSNLGNALNLLERYAEAMPLQEESYAIIRRLEATRFLPAALLNLGTSVNGVGEHERAQKLYWEALRGYEKLGHRTSVALCYHSLGLQSKQLRDFTTARDMLEQAISVLHAVGSVNIEVVRADLMKVEEALNNSENPVK